MFSCFWAIVKTRFRNALQYRLAAFAGILTQIFWGLIAVLVMEAFYTNATPDTAFMSLKQVCNYIWLGQAFLALLPWSFDQGIEAMIRDGRISYDFVRPRMIYSNWFARAFGWRTAAAIMRAIPLLFVATFVVPLLGMEQLALSAPVSFSAFLVFIFTIGLAALLGCSIVVLLNISLIWTISGAGTVTIVAAVVTLFSGMVIPLPLYPDLFQPILKLLPFPGLTDFPFRIYCGHIPIQNYGFVIIHQCVWIIIFVFTGFFALRRGVSKLVIQGG